MRKHTLFLFIAIILISISCNKDDDISEDLKGSIKVTVLNNNNQPVENAQVVLMDFGSQFAGDIKSSNSDGLVHFTNLDTGYYAISASKLDVGEASNLIFVEKPIEYELSLKLLTGYTSQYAPSIYITEPSYSTVSVMPIDTVNLRMQVADDDTPYSELNVTIECNIDGELFSGNPDAQNYVDFQLFPTTKGVHKITITAEDKNSLTTVDSIIINAVEVVPVKLSTTKQYKQVFLEWTNNIEQDFQRMEIRRDMNDGDGFQTIATISDQSVTSYVDSVIPYIKSANYKIITYDSEERYAESNVSGVNYPAGMYFYYTYDSDIQDVLVHPDRDWVYLIIADYGEPKIIIYDYIKDEIFKEIDLSYEPGYSILADNGSGLQLYIPGDNGAINIYSTDEELNLIKTIQTGDKCTSLGVNGNGIIVAGLDRGYNEEYAIRSFSQSTGALIDSTGTYTEVRIAGVPNKQNIFMGIDFTVSIYNMLYLEIDNDGNFIQNIEDPYFTEYDFDYRYISVAASGDYIISELDLFNTDSGLQHIVSFSETTTRGAVTNADGSIIYAYDFYIHDKITAYSYPSLNQVAQYDTREQARFIKVKGTQIIALTESSSKFIIEIIDL